MIRPLWMILLCLSVPLSLAGDAVGQQLPELPPTTRGQLSLRLQSLQPEIRRTLAYYYHRPINVAEKTPWSVMHSLVAFGVDTELDAGDRRVNAIGWLCWNQPARGMRLLEIQGSLPAPRQGPGLEGHAGQLLSMLAQSRVRAEYGVKVSGNDFTVADLVRHEQRTCIAGQELTFKLIGLAHYLPSQSRWKNDRGENWTIERLIQEELAQPVNGAACGGSHRLMGLSYAVQKRKQREQPVDGQWLRAARQVEQYQQYTLSLQNPDGSYSTSWFAGRGQSADQSERLRTTGHLLEWLAFSLPVEQLEDPRVVNSVQYLVDLLWNGRQQEWSIGPLGHALHALVIYQERAMDGIPGQPGAGLDRPVGVSRLP
ncbi:MAG: hypothetical protein VX715_01360 [Planctomycetota bacterium]|nr:hypothetical protein [Planctomycetota bacterium]